MTKRDLVVAGLLALVALAAAADTAAAKTSGWMPAPGGVTVPGSDYRYIAIAPGTPDKLTVVARVNRRGGRLTRWWYLQGGLHVPAVAYDGTPGGLSADGGTLVLMGVPFRFRKTYPPPVSRFAILDIERFFRRQKPWDRPTRELRPAQGGFFEYVDLRGDFSFDAISPDGSTVYLIHRSAQNKGPDYITHYEVRALDVESGRLLAEPIVDPAEPDERMAGLPITRATSPDGRWAYTLYDGDGHEPFVHALDTVGRRAVCVDLPQLEGRRDLFNLRLRVEPEGETLTVMSGPPPPRKLPSLERGRPVSTPTPHPLLRVDTASFEVSRATGPDGSAAEKSDAFWLPAGIGLLVLIAALGWERRSRRHRSRRAGAGAG
jgi:hypothetical protein